MTVQWIEKKKRKKRAKLAEKQKPMYPPTWVFQYF